MIDLDNSLPAFFPVFSAPVWHLIFELPGYFIAYRYFLLLRQEQSTPLRESEHMLVVMTGLIAGAAIVSKVLVWLQYPEHVWLHRDQWSSWLAGKTLVGGLLGGWLGVEVAKRVQGIRQRTGDLIVFPLILGMIIGRIGCFAAGLADDTYGVATALPVGIDFGDGISRHPTQLYEIFFLGGLWLVLKRVAAKNVGQGDLFRLFAAAYLLFRLGVDFLKPPHGGVVDPVGQWRTAHMYFGMLTAIQTASLIGLVMIAWVEVRRRIS